MSSSLFGKKLLHLQGLRGIAILSVVLFHFFPRHFSNGYIGVDMFFLLSGYLMTMMVSRKESFGSKNALDFLYRRVKRIAPLYFLTILGILGSLRFASISIRAANIQSAAVATVFATNLVKPTGIEGYFEKLGVAVDLFTHTWSLALEMQFYLLFPLIFMLYKTIPSRFSMFYLYLVSFVSFVFYFTSDSFTSFNSVFSRIWQFTAGMISFFTVSNNHDSDANNEEQNMLLSIEEGENEDISENNDKVSTSFTNSCLALILALMVSPEEVFPHFARLNTTILTALILQHGHRNKFLENPIIVFIGEASYAWYLIHWPIMAYCRVNELDCPSYLLAALLISFLIAVAIHLIFEKKYLNWEKLSIFCLLVVLLIAICAQIVVLKASVPKEEVINLGKVKVIGDIKRTFSKFNYPSDFMGNITYGYEDMTASQRINLNNAFQASDLDRTLRNYCKKFKKVKNPREFRCEMNEGVNKNSKKKLLVVGNSWASNLMAVVASECRQNFSHIEISFTGGCEALVNSESSTYYNCSYDYMFLDAVKEIKPDVLFVVDRHIQMMEINNGTNPFDDEHFKTASSRLAEMEKYVKQRIFVLDAFPVTSSKIIETVNYKLNQDKRIKDETLISMSPGFLTAKLRLARLVENCDKCRLFDYSSQFYFDGKFKIYDPKYFVSFFTYGQHLTPPGWERVRPLVRQMCQSV